MTLKKIFLSLVVVSVVKANIPTPEAQAVHSEGKLSEAVKNSLAGYYQNRFKAFSTGFILGAINGTSNRMIDRIGDNNQNRERQVAQQLNSIGWNIVSIGSQKSFPFTAILGHSVGKMAAESVIPDKDGKCRTQISVDFICALILHQLLIFS